MFAFLSSFSPKAIAVGLALAAGIVAAIGSWRLALLAFLAQYLLASLLLVQLIGLQVALTKALVGTSIFFALYLTAHQLSKGGWERIEGQSSPQAAFNSAFRLLAVLLVGLAVPSLAGRYPLPLVSPEMGLACYWLGSMGVLAAILREEPLRAGLGLLSFLLGFELFYVALEHSLSVLTLLGVIDLLIGLAIAYLALARRSLP